MGGKTILIVDDQSEIRRFLRTGLELLGQDNRLLDVPSGEEAMLVASSCSVDLLISDIRLAGMSGLELVEKARHRSPSIRVILITGSTDPAVWADIRQAAPLASYTKPLDLDTLLAAVSTALELKPTPSAPASSAPTVMLRKFNRLEDKLDSMQAEIQAKAVAVFDRWGILVDMAGELPTQDWPESLLTHLIQSASANARISQILGAQTPKDLLIFTGQHWQLALTHLGQDHILLTVSDKRSNVPPLSYLAGYLLRTASQILLYDLLNPAPTPPSLSAPPAIQHPGSLPQASGLVNSLHNASLQRAAVSPAEAPSPQDSLGALSAATGENSLHHLITPEVLATFDAAQAPNFWDSLSPDYELPAPGAAGSLSYEQARALGLAPAEG